MEVFLALSNLSISQGWWVGVFLSVEGRPRARLCRLSWRRRYLLADARKYRRNNPRCLSGLVISQERNGPVWRPSGGALLFGT